MKSKKPPIIEEVGFDFHWDSRRVWKPDIPITEMDIDELTWHLDVPFWEKEGTDDWNLTPREVINKSGGHEEHLRRILKADISNPIDIMENSREKVKIRAVPRSRIPEIISGHPE